jgi:predicted MFS family arabinose efflux permease
LHFAGVGIGIASSAIIVSALAALGFGWRAQWIAAASVSLVALAVVPKLVPPDESSGPVAQKPGAMALNRRLLALIAAYGLFGFGYVITATFLVAIVRGSAEIRHLEPVIWLILGVAAVPSVVLWSTLAGRIGVFATFAAACLVEALGVAASVLSVSTFGVLLAALCLGGTFVAITALGLVGVRSLSASDPRRVLAVMTVAFSIGQIIGPVLAGALVERSGGFTLPSIIAAGALVLAAILVAPLDRSRSGA